MSTEQVSLRYEHIAFCLHLADNALILAQRNAEWTGHGPILEQDIAISNIALDLLGQSRNFYQYAAERINQLSPEEISNQVVFGGADLKLPVSEDDLAFLRYGAGFRNALLVELPKGDWAHTILRQFFFSAYQYQFFGALQNGEDRQLAAIAEKSVREVAYHLRWSSEWVIRLGDGTAESQRRIAAALDYLWPYTGELLIPVEYETKLAAAGMAPDLISIGDAWTKNVDEVFEAAKLQRPINKWMQEGGKLGRHTEHLDYLLAEMQFLQRAYPGASW